MTSSGLDGFVDFTPEYELRRALGSGASGAVFSALERATGREVALKLMHARPSAVGLERFLREARLAATLAHPGVVRAHRAGLFEGKPCIVYELVDGEPLDRAARTLDLRRRVELVRDAARAVAHAHVAGVVHRDLKAENILVDRQGRARVTDFGVALVDEGARLTQTGGIVGTPTHMAPELFSGDRPVAGPASDVWSLGVVLYEVLTGRPPFVASTLFELMSQVEAGALVAPRSIDPEIPRSLEAVCLRALERAPADRPPDAGAFADELERALAGRGAGRRLGFVAAAVLVAVAVTCGALVIVARLRSTPIAAAPVDARPDEAAPAAPVVSAVAAVPGERPRPRRSLCFHRGAARWAVWLADARVVTGGAGEDVRLWDVEQGALVRAWSVRTSAGALTSDRRLLVASGAEVLRVDLEGGGVEVVAAAPFRITALSAASRAPRVVVVMHHRSDPALVLEADGREVARVPTRPSRTWRTGALSPDGALLALACEDALELFDLSSEGATLRHRQPYAGTGRAASFHPDGRRVYLGTAFGQLLVFDAAAADDKGAAFVDPASAAAGGLFSNELAHPAAAVRGVVVSPDGRRLVSLATSSDDAVELAVWDVDTRALVERVGALPGGEGVPACVVVSPDSSCVVVGDAAMTLVPLR